MPYRIQLGQLSIECDTAEEVMALQLTTLGDRAEIDWPSILIKPGLPAAATDHPPAPVGLDDQDGDADDPAPTDDDPAPDLDEPSPSPAATPKRQPFGKRGPRPNSLTSQRREVARDYLLEHKTATMTKLCEVTGTPMGSAVFLLSHPDFVRSDNGGWTLRSLAESGAVRPADMEAVEKSSSFGTLHGSPARRPSSPSKASPGLKQKVADYLRQIDGMAGYVDIADAIKEDREAVLMALQDESLFEFDEKSGDFGAA